MTFKSLLVGGPVCSFFSPDKVIAAKIYTFCSIHMTVLNFFRIILGPVAPEWWMNEGRN